MMAIRALRADRRATEQEPLISGAIVDQVAKPGSWLISVQSSLSWATLVDVSVFTFFASIIALPLDTAG
jgi:hypothetical protein